VAEDGVTKFLVDDDRSAKLEAELQKKLTRRDGSMMTLSQSKKYSQMHADNTAWEENRLLTSGVVRVRCRSSTSNSLASPLGWEDVLIWGVGC
jgi:hypothetical protein